MLMRPILTQIRCGNRLLNLASPAVMGIINVTPDSFYKPSRTPQNDPEILKIASKMVNEGAQIIDVGGMSTRPGAPEIPLAEEIRRVIPVIELLAQSLPSTVISVDTYRSEVAERAINAGATMVNDISGGNLDPEMPGTIARYNVAYVLMHMRGSPADMQSHTDYQDLTGHLLKYFVNKLREMHQLGIHDILIDPGFGFSKTMAHNYQLINDLGIFRLLGCPLLVGISRKSTLQMTIGRPVEETLHATTALHMSALINGASVLRVHDVIPAMDAIAVYNKLQEAKNH